MKLIFTKDANNEINVQLQKGTIIEDFSYTEMINQLLIQNDFDDTVFTNLSAEEQAKIQSMLDKISAVFKDDSTIEDEESENDQDIFNNDDLPF